MKNVFVWFLVSRAVPIGLYFLVGAAIEDAITGGRRTSRAFNCACSGFFQVFDFVVGGVFITGVASIVDRFRGRPMLFKSYPGWPFAVLVAIAISLTTDFLYYWFHRWQHSSRWLWPMHELHHSDESVNVTTSFRFHWLESPPRLLFGFLPGIFLPKPMVVLPLTYIIGCASIFYIHMDVPLQFGWLNRIIASPASHRVHHSTLPEHFDKNFAAVWPLWDLLFGTYAAPRKGERPPTGLVSGDAHYSVHDALVKPFTTWHRMIFR